MTLTFALTALVLSLIPALMFLGNLRLFCCLPEQPDASEMGRKVSVLVPARDEEAGIEACITEALGSEGVEVEVVVLDDDSTDQTAALVKELAAADSRVRLVAGKPLPEGWNGKQHACKQLAEQAAHPRLLFIDADVRLSRNAIARLVDYQETHSVGLLSAFPRQVTGTWLEKWLIPMMHFILLGYLPFSRMREKSDASLAAGCGQLFLTLQTDYRTAGTHEVIRQSRHDGVKLPRAYRNAGLMTDVVDGSELASCRMYHGAAEVVQGALKNATEGIANPRLIFVFTILLLGCSLLPGVSLALAIAESATVPMVISAIALAVAHLPRFVAASKLRQSWFGAVCHVPATVTFVALQWMALFNQLAGRKIAWRGRTES